MILSKRLSAIAMNVPHVKTAADIGTDHGYIPVYLIKNKVADRVVAADISPGSLAKARKLIAQEGLESRIEARLGSGLSVLKPGEADAIIIAGMGGMLIRDILEDGKAAADQAAALILQPMTAQDILRKWLIGHGFTIVDEVLTQEDSRFYEVIVAAPGYQETPEEIYYEVGYKLIEKRDPLLKSYLIKKIRHLENMMEHLKMQNTFNAQDRMKEVSRKVSEYRRICQWLAK